MSEKEKNSWGGKREGAGRKPLTEPNSNRKIFKTVSISGTEKEIGILKRQAAEKKKSFSRYVIEELVDESELEK